MSRPGWPKMSNHEIRRPTVKVWPVAWVNTLQRGFNFCMNDEVLGNAWAQGIDEVLAFVRKTWNATFAWTKVGTIVVVAPVVAPLATPVPAPASIRLA
eukprot:COSAG02_NODE_2441_length_8858_cov_31.570271_13_plen_98_part_00